MEIAGWLGENWFVLLQSVGIVASLLYAGVSFRFDARVRKVSNLLEITSQHRGIWTQLYQRPELARIRDPQADVKRQPISREEELFVSFLILHLNTSYRAIVERVMTAPDRLGDDVRQFFALPIPQAVWQRQRQLQDRDFVEFVESQVRK